MEKLPALPQALERTGVLHVVREASVVSALRDAGRGVHGSTDETRGDFLVDQKLLLEVGGPRKQRKDAEFVIRDGIDWSAPGITSLWTLGFMS